MVHWSCVQWHSLAACISYDPACVPAAAISSELRLYKGHGTIFSMITVQGANSPGPLQLSPDHQAAASGEPSKQQQQRGLLQCCCRWCACGQAKGAQLHSPRNLRCRNSFSRPSKDAWRTAQLGEPNNNWNSSCSGRACDAHRTGSGDTRTWRPSRALHMEPLIRQLLVVCMLTYSSSASAQTAQGSHLQLPAPRRHRQIAANSRQQCLQLLVLPGHIQQQL